MLNVDFELPQIPRSKMEIICEVLSIVGLILALVMIFSQYAVLPDVIPSHFGPNGVPDDWSSKSDIFFFAGVMVLIYIIVTISRFFPKMININVTITKKNAVPVLSIIFAGLSLTKLICIWMFFYIAYGMIETAKGNANGIGILIWVFVAALLVTVLGIHITSKKVT